eukprot:gene5400-9213_t
MEEYRKMMREKQEKQKQENPEKKKDEPPKGLDTIKHHEWKADKVGFNNTKEPTWFKELKDGTVLTEEEFDKLLKEHENEEEKITPEDIEMIKIHSEKVEYRKKLKEMEKEKIKKEREEKKKELENLRKQKHIGKKKVEKEEKKLYSPLQKEPISPFSKPCIIQIRMLDGSIKRVEFQTEDLLSRVCEYILEIGKLDENNKEKYETGFLISTNFPKRKFTIEEIETLTIENTNLMSQTLVIELSLSNGFKFKEKPIYQYVELVVPDWKLKGDSYEEKQRFKEKQNKEEIEKKRIEKIEKKKELQRIRQQIESNKKNKKGNDININNTMIIKKEEKKETKLRIRLLDGKIINQIYDPQSTIYDIFKDLLKKGYIISTDRILFFMNFPRREFKWNENIILRDSGLHPNGSLIIQYIENKGKVTKSDDSYHKDMINEIEPY